jgi:hypothetical protein
MGTQGAIQYLVHTHLRVVVAVLVMIQQRKVVMAGLVVETRST